MLSIVNNYVEGGLCIYCIEKKCTNMCVFINDVYVSLRKSADPSSIEFIGF